MHSEMTVETNKVKRYENTGLDTEYRNIDRYGEILGN